MDRARAAGAEATAVERIQLDLTGAPGSEAGLRAAVQAMTASTKPIVLVQARLPTLQGRELGERAGKHKRLAEAGPDQHVASRVVATLAAVSSGVGEALHLFARQCGDLTKLSAKKGARHCNNICS